MEGKKECHGRAVLGERRGDRERTPRGGNTGGVLRISFLEKKGASNIILNLKKTEKWMGFKHWRVRRLLGAPIPPPTRDVKGESAPLLH